VVQAPLQVFSPPAPFDLVMTCGVLIHLPPSDLPLIYQRLYDLTNRYILLNEYFSPQPVAMPYRGLEGHLYKRDFGGELWDCHGDRLRLVDYGFLWKRVEQVWDDTTWWLFEKAGQP
jgi:spore coat polysaccharide biosynthesis protein SpsF